METGTSLVGESREPKERGKGANICETPIMCQSVGIEYFTKSSHAWAYYFIHFTDEETEAQGSSIGPSQ